MEELQAAASIPLGPVGPPFPEHRRHRHQLFPYAAIARLAQRRDSAPLSRGVFGRLKPAADHAPWPRVERFVVALGREQARQPACEGSPLVRQE